MLCPPRWVCLRSCLPACLPSGLGCCVRLAGLVFLLSAVLSPVLSAILAGMPCPPCWAVSGLVSQLVSHLVWDALSASLVLSFSCLWSCLAAFVFVLSRSLSFIWDAVSAPPGLVFFLSLVLSPKLVSHLVWDAASASLALSFSCLSLVCGLVSGLVCHLGWDAVSASLGCLRSCLPACLPSGLGCCVCLAGLVFLLSAVLSPVLSAILAGMPCPPRWAVSGLVSQLVSHLVWDALSAFLVLSFSCLWSCLPAFVFVLSRSLSFIWDAVSGPPWACLFPQRVYCWGSQCCLKCVRLGWGAVSASLGLSPNLSPIWLCLSPWLGCCVRLAEHVSQFVSHLALSFSLAGVLCLRWGAVSASLVLSPNLYRIWLCLSPWLGCCVRLAGLVSQFVSSGFVFHWGAVSASLGLSPNLSPSILSPFVSHLALSFTLAGVLCPPRWACLPICLIWLCLSLGCCVRLAGLVSQFVSQCSFPICFPSGFVFHLGWGAASASLGLSPVLSPNLFRTWLCLLRWLGCCVCLAGRVSQFISHLPLSFTLAGVLCPPRRACLLIPQTVYGWGSQCFLYSPKSLLLGFSMLS